jgi:mono/diheme cytochrome c family protein
MRFCGGAGQAYLKRFPFLYNILFLFFYPYKNSSLMKKVFKWAGIFLGSLVLILVVSYTIIYFRVEGRFNKTYEIAVKPLAIPSDSAAIALGRHIAGIKGCDDCHGENYGGNVVIDDPALGRLVGPNITTGKGGLTDRHGSFTDVDYIRAIRHGIGKDGRSLKLMPSYEYYPLSKQDLGALIAYLKTIPPVDSEMPGHEFGPMGYILTNFDKLPLMAAELVDHEVESPDVVIPEVTASYGKYVAVSCTGCHRDNFKGGDALIPGSPPVPNITATGSLAKWTEEQFIKTLQTGVTPEGKSLDPQYMPWPMAKRLTDTEIKSVYLFLKSQDK